MGGILILAQDITHRKQMEDALSEISRKLIQSQEHSRESRARKALRDETGNRAQQVLTRRGPFPLAKNLHFTHVNSKHSHVKVGNPSTEQKEGSGMPFVR